MFKVFARIFKAPVFTEDEDKTRTAELLNTILYVLTLVAATAAVALILGSPGPFTSSIFFAILAFILIFLQIPLRQGHVIPVSYSVVILITAALTFIILREGSVRSPVIVLFAVTILISSLTIGRMAALWTAVANITIFISLMFLEINGRLSEPPRAITSLQWIIFTASNLLIALVLGIGMKRITESLAVARSEKEELAKHKSDLEQGVQERTEALIESTRQVQRRASHLEAIAKVARSAASARNLDSMLTAVTEEASRLLGFYHIGIFLVDSSGDFAILRASNSEGGQQMLANGHRLKVGQQGIVGFVTSRGIPRIALDVGSEAVFFNNPLLPDTHSEVALPLKFGDEIIGALDIQSRDVNAFSQDDIATFTVLADQVSVAIQNTQSLERAQRALREVEVTSNQLTQRAWEKFADAIRTRGYRYDGIKPEPVKEDGREKTAQDGLLIPVNLRGQTIGRLKLKTLDDTRKLTDDEMAVVQSTAERLALALEGARLLEDAQQRAARETFLSTVAAKLSTSFQLDSILRDTVEELGQNLKDSTVTFQLVNPNARPTAEETPENH